MTDPDLTDEQDGPQPFSRTAPPLVRNTDPDTSRQAARPTPARNQLRDLARQLLTEHGPLTDWELFERSGLHHGARGSLIKRRAETGAVDSGERRNSPSGHPCIVWELP